LLKTYTKLNFHSYTFCIWKEVLFSEIQDNYTSQSGSQYIFTVEGLYRISNHWGRVANCHWRLIPLAQFKNQSITVAFANWTDFYSNDDSSKLFYIKLNPETQEVNFFHKQSIENDEKVILRNAKATAKTIRIIKEVMTDIAWSQHLKFEDIDELRNEIVEQLITTEKSFLDIKKQYLF
jgi:hypothetical protein